MKATKKNEEIARRIINILGEKECTVAESIRILSFVSNEISNFTTVQKIDKKLFETQN
ncbi:hypothetical protein AB8U03_17855 [Clostridium sp. Mt-5]|uniref:Uncharacterized protein n=1 Tax=Clostridium moutaii TaxID=3240932 RepID=A0ABV4BU21_9CLOT